MFVLPMMIAPGGAQARHDGRLERAHVPLEDARAAGRRHGRASRCCPSPRPARRRADPAGFPAAHARRPRPPHLTRPHDRATGWHSAHSARRRPRRPARTPARRSSSRGRRPGGVSSREFGRRESPAPSRRLRVLVLVRRQPRNEQKPVPHRRRERLARSRERNLVAAVDAKRRTRRADAGHRADARTCRPSRESPCARGCRSAPPRSSECARHRARAARAPRRVALPLR